jgi:ADP-ribose pyrophosphatase YjhB (NUDIX family)
VIREAVRVLLVAPDERVLLLAAQDEDARRFWFPPGGGLEDGEDARAAAVREVREETGFALEDVGVEVWRRRHVFHWRGEEIDQRERWFLTRVAGAFTVDRAGWTPGEREDLRAARWWTPAELAAATDRLVPDDLAARLRPLLRDGPSDASSTTIETLPTPELLADSDAAFLIGVNVDRVSRSIADLGLHALGAFALWVPNEAQFMEPSALSVCSSEEWRRRLAPFATAPDPHGLAVAMDPQAWDHPEVDLVGPPDPERFDAASARLYERCGDERDPAAQVLAETARRIAQAPSVVAGPVLVAMVTEGNNASDETLKSIRYASPPASVATLEAAGLPQSYWDLP